jgi:hypothetical protein
MAPAANGTPTLPVHTPGNGGRDDAGSGHQRNDRKGCRHNGVGSPLECRDNDEACTDAKQAGKKASTYTRQCEGADAGGGPDIGQYGYPVGKVAMAGWVRAGVAACSRSPA